MAAQGKGRKRAGSAPRGSGPGPRRGAPARSSGTQGSKGGGRGARPPAARRAPAAAPAPRRSGPKGLGGERVEGRQAVRELLLAGKRRAREVVLAADMDHADILDDIVELAQELKVPVREVSKSKFDALARTEAPQGVLAEAARLPERTLDELMEPTGGQAPFLIALDGVTDPGNLGALLRTAECAGVTGVVLPRHRAVHITPTVTKTAAGAIEFLPMSLVGGLPTAITQMQQRGVWVVGLDERGETRLDALDLSQPVCLVLGAEGAGLGRLVRQRCDAVAGIPLRGQLNSLNVAAAGAVACFEVARQRS
jgi:23S rRNA (guanosine2251-2'-O)-methyltransferase